VKDLFPFKCTECGACCSSYGFVYLTTEDRVRLSRHFGLTVAQFTRRYCAKNHSEYHLADPESDCCFLADGKCAVYEARPSQCRTWPLWPENFSGGKIKQSAAADCPALARIMVGDASGKSALNIVQAERRSPPDAFR